MKTVYLLAVGALILFGSVAAVHAGGRLGGPIGDAIVTCTTINGITSCITVEL